MTSYSYLEVSFYTITLFKTHKQPKVDINKDYGVVFAINFRRWKLGIRAAESDSAYFAILSDCENWPLPALTITFVASTARRPVTLLFPWFSIFIGTPAQTGYTSIKNISKTKWL